VLLSGKSGKIGGRGEEGKKGDGNMGRGDRVGMKRKYGAEGLMDWWNEQEFTAMTWQAWRGRGEVKMIEMGKQEGKTRLQIPLTTCQDRE
jgi:hypothetical protein